MLYYKPDCYQHVNFLPDRSIQIEKCMTPLSCKRMWEKVEKYTLRVNTKYENEIDIVLKCNYHTKQY